LTQVNAGVAPAGEAASPFGSVHLPRRFPVKEFPHRFIAALALAVGLQFATPAGVAAGFDDREALAGVKEVKVAFDITAGEGKKLLGQIKVIDETRRSLIRQGVTPHFVLAFRGPATRLIQTDQSKIKPEDREIALKIAAKLDQMRRAQGIEGMEQCSVAVRQQETKAEDVIASVKVVGNGWISLMALENRGYAYIAP
jgi:intracellular sulfur oxidation DsrE/DsrF family protein